MAVTFPIPSKTELLSDQLGEYQLLYALAPYGQKVKLQVATHHEARQHSNGVL
jgi:hypothetical protein